jgi:hypothetical protein
MMGSTIEHEYGHQWFARYMGNRIRDSDGMPLQNYYLKRRKIYDDPRDKLEHMYRNAESRVDGWQQEYDRLLAQTGETWKEAYDLQDKAHKVTTEFFKAADEFFADTVSVAIHQDPQIKSKNLNRLNRARELVTRDARVKTLKSEIPSKEDPNYQKIKDMIEDKLAKLHAEWEREDEETEKSIGIHDLRAFDIPPETLEANILTKEYIDEPHGQLYRVRYHIWTKYLSKMPDPKERAVFLRAVLLRAIELTEKQFIGAKNLSPSTAEMNSELIKHIDELAGH